MGLFLSNFLGIYFWTFLYLANLLSSIVLALRVVTSQIGCTATLELDIYLICKFTEKSIFLKLFFLNKYALRNNQGIIQSCFSLILNHQRRNILKMSRGSWSPLCTLKVIFRNNLVLISNINAFQSSLLYRRRRNFVKTRPVQNGSKTQSAGMLQYFP